MQCLNSVSIRCRDTESNCGHQHFQCCALPTELSRQKNRSFRSEAEQSYFVPGTIALLLLCFAQTIYRAGDEIRTHDLLLGKETFYRWTTPALMCCTVYLELHFLANSKVVSVNNQVDPVGFEPTIFSLQRRRLPARPRAQISNKCFQTVGQHFLFIF